MKSFSEISKEFFKSHNCKNLVNQLRLIENNGFSRPGDYYAFGCEFVLNGMNTGSECFNLGEILGELDNHNYSAHYFELRNKWDTFLFYSPNDFRGLIFDFSSLYSDEKIICYNGLMGPKNLNKFTEYTIDEFLNEYGLSRLYSISHWNVNWKNLGVNWNN